jgi:epoxyqueuosine reductase QueG
VLPDYRPNAIWHLAKTVIVVGVPMLLPIVESTPSINYQEMYNASNVLLDQLAFRLSLFLNGRGFASVPIPRDGYGNFEILLKKMPASFSHVYAGKYAGPGTIGFSHNLINPQFGPRARYVSVVTAAEIDGDPVIGKISARTAKCARGCALRRRFPRALTGCRRISTPWLVRNTTNALCQNRAGLAGYASKSARSARIANCIGALPLDNR